jgi:GNAT superfamily N-acetyltransferase
LTPQLRPDAARSGSTTGSAIRSNTLEIDGAALDWFLVPWDTAIFGFPVAQISRIVLGDDPLATGILREFDAWCADHDVRLVSCRLDHLQLPESMALEADGFRFVEMVYQPRLGSLDRVARPKYKIHVSAAGPDDLPAIQEIAYAAFSTGRFLLDRRLAPELSRRRYATWVRSTLDTPEQELLKAEFGADLVGFFIVEHRSDASVYWHLTAIAPDWQGQGLGLSLWRTMLLRHRTEGATLVDTTISGHNTAAMDLYARLGFSFSSAQMTFHRLGNAEV